MPITPAQAYERAKHRDVEMGIIVKVEETESAFFVSFNHSGIRLLKPVELKPEIGHRVTVYLSSGSLVQGVDLDGTPLFFKSQADLEVARQEALRQFAAEKAKNKIVFFAEYDDLKSGFNRRLKRLPKVFQQRFKKFFRLGEDFWDVAWYELVACETALQIAYACKSWQGIRRFTVMSDDEKKALIPNLDDGLSGNQFGFACAAAKVYLHNPKMVRKIRGALSPLTGSRPYIGQ